MNPPNLSPSETLRFCCTGAGTTGAGAGLLFPNREPKPCRWVVGFESEEALLWFVLGGVTGGTAEFLLLFDLNFDMSEGDLSRFVWVEGCVTLVWCGVVVTVVVVVVTVVLVPVCGSCLLLRLKGDISKYNLEGQSVQAPWL